MGKRERYEQHKNSRLTVINRGHLQKLAEPVRNKELKVWEILTDGTLIRNRSKQGALEDYATINGYVIK